MNLVLTDFACCKELVGKGRQTGRQTDAQGLSFVPHAWDSRSTDVTQQGGISLVLPVRGIAGSVVRMLLGIAR